MPGRRASTGGAIQSAGVLSEARRRLLLQRFAMHGLDLVLLNMLNRLIVSRGAHLMPMTAELCLCGTSGVSSFLNPHPDQLQIPLFVARSLPQNTESALILIPVFIQLTRIIA